MIFGPVSQLTLSETGPANDPIQSLLGTSSQIYSASLHLLFCHDWNVGWRERARCTSNLTCLARWDCGGGAT